MPTFHIVQNYSRKFFLRTSGGVLGLGMVNNNYMKNEMNEYILDTYEQKEAFLQSIHEEIADKIIDTDALYNTSAKEYTI